MSELEETIQNSRHIAIQLHHEVHKIWKMLIVKTKAGDVDDLSEFEFIRNFMLLGSLVEGIALDLKDTHLALATLGVAKYGEVFVDKIKEDMKQTKAMKDNGEIPPVLLCNCLECSKVAEEAVQMTKDIVEKALRAGKDNK